MTSMINDVWINQDVYFFVNGNGWTSQLFMTYTIFNVKLSRLWNEMNTVWYTTLLNSTHQLTQNIFIVGWMVGTNFVICVCLNGISSKYIWEQPWIKWVIYTIN